MTTGRRAILIDIDHVIADAFSRDELIGGELGWDHYHSQSVNDAPLRDITALLDALHVDGYELVGLTARPEKWRQLTMGWLCKYNIPMDELLMRADNDYRAAGPLKLQLAVDHFITEQGVRDNVAFVMDDRDDVIAAFQAIGVTGLQVFGRRLP